MRFLRAAALLFVAALTAATDLAAADCSNAFAASPGLPGGVGSAVFLADFDGDGILDIASAGPFDLAIFLGHGDGTFDPPVNTEYDFGAQDFVVGNFDPDPFVDVALGSISGVELLRGNGDGTFQPPIPVTGVGRSLAAGDLNGDSKLDLVGGSFGLAVMLGNGDGTFQPPIEYSTSVGITSLAAADLDGDGHVDVAATADGVNAVQIYPGVGDGTLETPLPVVAGLALSHLAVADVGPSPYPDLVLVADGLVAVLIAEGDFHYQAAQDYQAEPEAEAIGVTPADIDGDGATDLVVTARGGPYIPVAAELVLLRNAGDGSFSPAGRYAVFDAPAAAATGDLDGDGRSDVVAGGGGTLPVAVLLNTGDGRLEGQAIWTSASAPSAAGDVNEDGFLDLVHSGPWISLGGPGGRFEGAATQPTARGVDEAGIADFDGDGHLDVVGNVGGYGNPIQLLYYRGHGDGTFDEPVSFPAPGIANSASGLIVGDLDGDTKLDVAVATWQSSSFTGQLTVFLGDGAGGFTLSAAMAVNDALVGGLAAADFDGDGVTDLASAGSKFFDPDATLYVFLGRGNGTFDLPQTTDLGVQTVGQMAAAEILQPGVADLVMGLGNATVILPGNDDGSFDAPQTVVGLPPRGLAVADFDGDAVLDVMIASDHGETFVKGLGGGAWDEPVTYASSGPNGRPVVGDYDRNGFLDTAVGVTSLGVAVLLNARLGATLDDTSAIVGSPAALQALAGGHDPLTFQWRKGGVPLTDGGPISGATTATLTVDPVSFDDAGSYDVVVTDACGEVTSNAAALTVEFADVPDSSPFHDDIITIATEGITGGCGGGNYCPTLPVRRDQMTVFLLKGEHGSNYTPPDCAGVFNDVPCPGPFTNWVEQLAAEGVTGGCGGGNYCPSQSVTRAQMAIFLLKTREGSSYTPPAATGIFGDVPLGSFGADFIEELYNRAITGGCSASPLLYCPTTPVPRQQMATFLVRTFAP